jgi:hypothetical protein
MAFRKEPGQYDPHELGARRSDPELAALEPLPQSSRRVTNGQLLLAFFAAVVVIAFVRNGGPGGGPAVAGSCTQPAFALNKTEVKSGGVLKWSAAGPTASEVAFAVDSDTLPATLDAGLLAGPLPLSGCKRSGQFGIRASEGEHVVTVFLVDAEGTTTVLGTKKVTVDAP